MKVTSTARDALRCSVVEIRLRSGELLGTGIPLSQRHVLTCKHILIRTSVGPTFREPADLMVHRNHLTYRGAVVEERSGCAVESVTLRRDGDELHQDVALLTSVGDLGIDPSRVLPWSPFPSGHVATGMQVMIAAHRQNGAVGVESASCSVAGWNGARGCHCLDRGVAKGFSGGLVARLEKSGWRAVGMLVARLDDVDPLSFMIPQARLQTVLDRDKCGVALPAPPRVRRTSAATAVPSKVAQAQAVGQWALHGVSETIEGVGQSLYQQRSNIKDRVYDLYGRLPRLF